MLIGNSDVPTVFCRLLWIWYGTGIVMFILLSVKKYLFFGKLWFCDATSQ